jgi:hypothetical protein
MPKVALELEPEMMDMDEPTTPEPVEPEEKAEDQQEEEEYEETITIRASDFVALQDTLEECNLRSLRLISPKYCIFGPLNLHQLIF